VKLTSADADGYARCMQIVADREGIERRLVKHVIMCLARSLRQVRLGLDATDDPLRGHQEWRVVDGCFGRCSHPTLHITTAGHGLCARLILRAVTCQALRHESISGGERGGSASIA
jgi:hypothetical protein